ncbi:hypothetical protein Tco_0018542 [Tanacetum coccineum]
MEPSVFARHAHLLTQDFASKRLTLKERPPVGPPRYQEVWLTPHFPYKYLPSYTESCFLSLPLLAHLQEYLLPFIRGGTNLKAFYESFYSHSESTDSVLSSCFIHSVLEHYQKVDVNREGLDKDKLDRPKCIEEVKAIREDCPPGKEEGKKALSSISTSFLRGLYSTHSLVSCTAQVSVQLHMRTSFPSAHSPFTRFSKQRRKDGQQSELCTKEEASQPRFGPPSLSICIHDDIGSIYVSLWLSRQNRRVKQVSPAIKEISNHSRYEAPEKAWRTSFVESSIGPNAYHLGDRPVRQRLCSHGSHCIVYSYDGLSDLIHIPRFATVSSLPPKASELMPNHLQEGKEVNFITFSIISSSSGRIKTIKIEVGIRLSTCLSTSEHSVQVPQRSDPADEKENSALLLSRRTYPPRDS